jgi:uncharacterized protein YheU (UPF0270 family)
MEIPHTQLADDVLRAVIEEYITREGTDYGDREYTLDEKVKQIIHQLRRREVLINYDPDTGSCQLAPCVRQFKQP